MSKPTVGRIVHYVSYGTPGGEFKSECRAAIIAAVHDLATVDLVVFNPTGLYFNNDCPNYEPTPLGGAPGDSWHWPEREPADTNG